jgi:hypothetical protein
MHYFRVQKLRSIHFEKRQNLCFESECTISGTDVANHPFYIIGTKMMFGSVSEHLANLRHEKRCKTCVMGLNALFQGTEVVKHPFYSIGTKTMFGSVSEYFANHCQFKRRRTCVSGQNALFQGTEVVKHPFYSVGPKMMLGLFQSISLTFTTLKDGKLVFRT